MLISNSVKKNTFWYHRRSKMFGDNISSMLPYNILSLLCNILLKILTSLHNLRNIDELLKKHKKTLTANR